MADETNTAGSGRKEKRDWFAWHGQYQDESSPLRQRLSIVQREIRRVLPAEPDRSFLTMSVCAGQGNDLVPVLQEYPHTHLVRARLVESDSHNIEKLRAIVHAAGLDHLEIVHADAADTAVYSGIVPADLILICGVFGNISDADIHHTIISLPQLCRAGSTVIWTRSRRSPDITPSIRQWFQFTDFEERALYAPDGVLFAVGAHVFRGQSMPLQNMKLFTFLI